MSWQLALVAIGLLVLIPVVVQRPVVAIYVMVGAATIIEIFPLGFQDSLTDTIPFFLNLNNSAGLPVSITPAEILMAVALIAWISSTASQRSLFRPSRTLLRPYAIFIGVVLVAEAWGILNGGNWNISLWELRPQIYGFILFVLTASLVRERRQVVVLAVVFLCGATFKAGIGYYRYFNTLNQSLTDTEAILAHEDSYFLVLFLVAAAAAAIWIRRYKLLGLLLLAAPLVAITMLENRRRAAMLALWAALAVIAVLGIRFEARVRRQLIVATAVVALCFIGFLVVFWNSEWGLSGQIVRPFHSLTGQVDQRDYLSNLYRDNENLDLKATYATSPVIGIGFGRPMLDAFPLADISEQDPLWQYITHNGILWIAMNMGVVGMAAFWALVCMIALAGVRALRRQQDPFLRAVASFAMAALVAELVVAYGDMQLENYRNMIFTGTMIGLIDALPLVRVATVREKSVAERQAALHPLAAGRPDRRWAPVPASSASSHRR